MSKKHISMFMAAGILISAAFPVLAADTSSEANLFYGDEQPVTEEVETEALPDLNQGYPFYSNPKKSAPMGIWLKAYRLSYADGDDHIVYFRITDIVDCDVDTNDIIEFNRNSTTGYIGELEDPYLTYKELFYDVFYPEDFPTGSDGYVVDPTLSFSIKNPEGDGFKSDRGYYVGLAKVQSLDMGFEAEDGLKIHPGEVFHGRSIFAMLKEETPYVLEYACRQSEPDGDVIYQYTDCLTMGEEEQ